MSWSFSHSNINNNNPRLPVAKLLIRSLSLTAALVTSGILTSPIMASAATTIQTNSTGSSAVSTGTVRTALDKTGTVLPTSATTQQQADTPTGLKVATGGSELTIPKDAKSGITLASLGIKVSLPNANTATTGQTVANGVVAYGGTNGSANAVQANPDGSIRMLNVISNATAPTDYTYTVTLPQGTTLRAETTGGISILDAKGQIVAVVDVPWAKDAKGTPIQTSYNVKGNVITQHIAHNVKGVVYPVTADPQISFGWWIYVRLSPQDQKYVIGNAFLFVPIVCARISGSINFVAGCSIAGGAVANWLSNYYNPSKWVEVRLSYNGNLAGIKRL
jgi:hypothetical protein